MHTAHIPVTQPSIEEEYISLAHVCGYELIMRDHSMNFASYALCMHACVFVRAGRRAGFIINVDDANKADSYHNDKKLSK